MQLLALLISLLPLSLASPTPPNKVYLPPPTGPHKHIGTTTHILTDHSRTELYGPPNTPRRIVVQSFYPLSHPPKCQVHAAYAPPLTLSLLESELGLPNGTFSALTTNSFLSPPPPADGLVPLLFSPGFGMMRGVYTTIYEQLASHGYFVLAIDHPFDGAVVEYPDNTTAPALSTIPPPTPGEEDKYMSTVHASFLHTRILDSHFAATQLPLLFPGLRMQKLGMLGHSLGGATVAGAMALSPKLIHAGVDMDGTIFPPANETDLGLPFLIMGTDIHNSTSPDEPSWSEFRRSQSGYAGEVAVKGFLHMSYTDAAALGELLGMEKPFPEFIKQLVGDVSTRRTKEIVDSYLSAFFGWTLLGKEKGLLTGESTRFPEVKFL